MDPEPMSEQDEAQRCKPDNPTSYGVVGLIIIVAFGACFICQLLLLISGAPHVSNTVKQFVFLARQHVAFADGVQGTNYIYATQVCQTNDTTQLAESWQCHGEILNTKITVLAIVNTVLSGLNMFVFYGALFINSGEGVIISYIMCSLPSLVISCVLAALSASLHKKLKSTVVSAPSTAQVVGTTGVPKNTAALLAFVIIAVVALWVTPFLFFVGENAGLWGKPPQSANDESKARVSEPKALVSSTVFDIDGRVEPVQAMESVEMEQVAPGLYRVRSADEHSISTVKTLVDDENRGVSHVP